MAETVKEPDECSFNCKFDDEPDNIYKINVTDNIELSDKNTSKKLNYIDQNFNFIKNNLITFFKNNTITFKKLKNPIRNTFVLDGENIPIFNYCCNYKYKNAKIIKYDKYFLYIYKSDIYCNKTQLFIKYYYYYITNDEYIRFINIFENITHIYKDAIKKLIQRKENDLIINVKNVEERKTITEDYESKLTNFEKINDITDEFNNQFKPFTFEDFSIKQYVINTENLNQKTFYYCYNISCEKISENNTQKELERLNLNILANETSYTESEKKNSFSEVLNYTKRKPTGGKKQRKSRQLSNKPRGSVRRVRPRKSRGSRHRLTVKK